MDVQKKLDEIVAAVEGARSMPMSASCVVNRAELLAMLSEVRDALPDSLSQAQALLGDREQMVAEARAEAERIIASAHEQRGSLVSDTEVARRSQAEADRILAEARAEAEEIRAEADEYVDSKLANFEVVLTKTLGSVDRGREKLLGRGPGTDDHGHPDDEAPERSADPEELRRRADAYVDAKLGAFETVLAKTLEAVGRGRQKLTGHRPIDELAAHMAAQDGLSAEGTPLAAQQSDAEYLAGLAGAHPEPVAQEQPVAYDYPQQPEYAPMAAEYGGYQQDPYQSGGYDAYGYVPQQVEYTDPAYGWQQQGYEHQIPQQHQPQDHHQQQPYQQHTMQPTGLDETSFFDTGLIDLDRLRELEQGR
ncbi:cell division initiation protein [Streptantibioticus rubrisoli]|uniref:Cell division initiation protein n=1 Tax=Streptantibioticus rubrisoli TaxID=1387313 RepID=A0ABT1PL38_9ACTN|nr:cell division initiation protein [Streptantibioticus rubrisoli]MCQ4046064.1 cell division initiation protein [Streptantibioticus rubrisoli]